MDDYLDEFTCAFNRSNSRKRGRLWYRPVEPAVATRLDAYV